MLGEGESCEEGQVTTNLRDYLRIKEAAQFLGVSPSTLRNWERSGKLTARRHPINRYRLYRRSELERLLRELERATHGNQGVALP